MKKRMIISSILSALLICGVLTGCGDVSGDTETSTAQSDLVKAGQTVQFDGWDVTLNRTEVSSHIENIKGPDEGNVFALITFTVKNNDTESASLLETYSAKGPYRRARIYFDGKYEYNPSGLLFSSYIDLSSDNIKPLETKQGIILFEIPEEASNVDLLTLVLDKGPETITFDLESAIKQDDSSNGDTSLTVSNVYPEVDITNQSSASSNSPIASESKIDNNESAATTNYKLKELKQKSTLGNFEIMVMGTDCPNEIKNEFGGIFTPNEGSYYCLTYINVKNIGDSIDSFFDLYPYPNSPTISLVYGNKYRYSPTTLIGYESDLHNKGLNPLESVTGTIAFSVPDEMRDWPGPITVEISQGSQTVGYRVQY